MVIEGFGGFSGEAPSLDCDFPWESLGRAFPRALERDTPFPVALPPKYELLGRLGSGAAGTVFLARDRFLDRPLAVKLLHANGRADLDRFLREARLMARLEDPAIVRVFEMDEHEGRTYIAMEYVDGGNLERARLAPRALVGTVRPLVDALAHAHALGVVHRDIKPENILLDHGGRAYLTDFGLARDALAPEVGDEGILGTPLTMSPEQIRGGAADRRSDVFSLGVTLYRALTRRWPFQGQDLSALLDAVLHADPAPLQEHDASISASLASIVLRCVEKEPACRYQGMEELGRELDLFLLADDEGHRLRGWRSWVQRLVPRQRTTRRSR